MVQIMIADEMDLMALGARTMLRKVRDFSLIGDYQQPKALDEALAKTVPDVLLLSERFDPDREALALLDQLKHQFPALTIIFLGTLSSGLLIGDLLEAGAAGYLHRADPLRDGLNAAIWWALRGRTFLSPTAQTLVLTSTAAHLRALDEEARVVLGLLAEGLSIHDIAKRLQVSPRRVYRVRDKLRRRFGAQTNEHLIRRAVSEGLSLPSG